jgi:hypothetical protein
VLPKSFNLWLGIGVRLKDFVAHREALLLAHGHPASKLDELLPWNWCPADAALSQAA